MQSGKLAKNVGIMSIAVFFSRILGLIRDQVMAYYFGANYLNDAFNIGYNIPNLLRRLFGEGALSAAFIPLYNEIGIKRGKREQFQFAMNVLSNLTLLLTFLTLIGIAFSPWIVRIIYPGIPHNTLVYAISLSRIMFPYLFIIGLSSTMIAILNSHEYFFMTGLSSALLNIGMVVPIIGVDYFFHLSSEQMVIVAGWGVIFGGVLQTVVNFPYLKKIGYNFKIVVKFSGEAMSTLWKRFIPGMIGLGVREINLIVDSLIASYLPVGSISALSYGNRLMQLPLGIFGIATGTALLPMFSKNVAEENWSALAENLRFAIISMLYIMIPITAMIIALGNDIVYALFQRGAFDAHATQMTYRALVCYSLGLVFFGMNQSITPVFYANKDTKTPVYIAAWMVGLNIILNLILMQFLSHAGLALATSISAAVQFAILMIMSRKKFPQAILKRIWHNVIKIFAISVLIYYVIYFLQQRIVAVTLMSVLIRTCVMGILGFLIMFFASHVLKVDYSREISSKLWQKLVKRSNKS